MPEIKRTFQAGRMNRSLDERLVKSGEYREALNVNIGRSDSSDIGAVENILGNVKISNTNAIEDGICIGSYRDNGNERIYFFVTNNNNDNELNDGEHAIFEYNQGTAAINLLASGSWLNLHQNFLITGINFVDDLLFFTDNRNEPRKINVNRARNNPNFYKSDDTAAVAKVAPFTAPTIDRVDSENESNFMEDKFIRFAYRYKFNDNEFSTISLFTPICFESPRGEITSLNSAATRGEIADFVNSIRRVFLSVQVPVNAGITGIEWLYNESTTSNIYILDDVSVNTISINDDPIEVEYTYESQDPFRALPASQLVRVYDAVPRLAQAQEFAGGRIVYGNYLQNYNLPSMSFEVTAVNKYESGEALTPLARQSVKSRRTYQVGVVLADKYGRQSPVILSSTGGDTVNVTARINEFGVYDDDNNTAAQKLQIKFNTDFPDWAHSYRIVVKQREQEYHNWFWNRVTDSDDEALIEGNNTNKVPRDTTGQTELFGNKAIAPTTVEIFRKFEGVNNVSDDSVKLTSITYDSDGTVYAKVPNNVQTASGVYETSPVTSELDIFYETSTGGLTADVTDASIDIDFFNCYILDVSIFGHLELNRLRAGFNTTWFTIGVKAYAVQENFSEQRRFNTLIHSSGLFNSRIGVNGANQFNEADGGITISLDPADGSVQKLFAEDTQLIIFQEDKVSRSPIDKDFIYSAEGGAVPVTSSTQYLGTIAPYAGEYGISKNPESFAVYGTRKYFSDKNRGVVLRLSNDGLTEISENGMTDFFRDAIASSTKVIGSFDEYHDNYNVTIVGDATYSGFKDTNVATASDGYFTVSFEEEVGGWPSFKSFNQESATTLNNRYYSFNGGDLWEHNVGTTYNNFYGTQVESYLECLMNDNPSDVKEFKTIGYEGKAGWVCDTVETDQDNLRLDPNARLLASVVEAKLVIIEEVSDGNILGAQTQRLLVGETPRWVIKVEPANPSYIFTSPDDIELTFESDGITGVLNEDNNSLYFTIVANNPITVDEFYDVTIKGAANEDISGAILTISFLDDFTETSFLTAEIDQESDFRAGQSILAYSADDVNPEVPLSLSLANEDPPLYQFGEEDDLLITPSNTIDPLLTFLDFQIGNYNLEFETQQADWIRLLNLPVSTTSGTISIGNAEGKDFIRQRPTWQAHVPRRFMPNSNVTYFNEFAYTNEEYDNASDRNIRFVELVGGDLFDYADEGSVEGSDRYLDGDVITTKEFYAIPNYDSVNGEGWYARPGVNPALLDGNNLGGFTSRVITKAIVTDSEGALEANGDTRTLIGAIGFTLTSPTLNKSADRNTVSAIITDKQNVNIELYRTSDPQFLGGGLTLGEWRPAGVTAIEAVAGTDLVFSHLSGEVGFSYRFTLDGAVYTDVNLQIAGFNTLPYTNPLNPIDSTFILPGGGDVTMTFSNISDAPVGELRFHITPRITNTGFDRMRVPETEGIQGEYSKIINFA